MTAAQTAGQASTHASINFEDFRRFQMLVAYHLEEIKRALTMFGEAASATGDTAAGASARFGASVSRVHAWRFVKASMSATVGYFRAIYLGLTQ
jgi:hypothetical protein